MSSVKIAYAQINPTKLELNVTSASKNPPKLDLHLTSASKRRDLPDGAESTLQPETCDSQLDYDSVPQPPVSMGRSAPLKPPPTWPANIKPNQEPKSTKPNLSMAPSPKAESSASSGSGRERGFEPEGSADITPPYSESHSNSPPSYLKWAETLHNLLADPDGVELYKIYLKMENVGELLDFWFACEGLKRQPSEPNEKIFQLIKVINRKFLRSKIVPIAEETRKVISEKIGSKNDMNQTIFDGAQEEVEDRMTRTTYRNFLTSELYLNYVQSMQTGESDFSAKCSGSHSSTSSISGRGPPGDDSGHFSVAPESEKVSVGSQSHSHSTHGQPTACKQSDNTSDSTSGISDTSSGSIALPCPAPTASMNQSLDDSELVETPSQLVSNLSTLPTLHENSELDLTSASTGDKQLGALTSHALMATQKRRHLKPGSQEAGLFQMQSQMGRVPHPYHAYNSAYNPVSRQDSELQSLSSDNQTTDDNMSSFTENSSLYSYRNITSKKHLRRQVRKMQEQSRHNRELSSTANTAHQQQTFIPRTARVPVEATQQLPPAQFAAILTQKLEKVKRDQELNEKLSRKLSEDTKSMVSGVSQDSNRSLADILREKLIVPDDSDQSILDDHVSRIWTDKTPLRSPGDPTGRPRSPGHQRRHPPGTLPHAAPLMGPPGKIPLGPMAGHRTLPSRGHHRLAASGVARRPPAHQVYHQDLAYYEIDPERGVGGHPGQGEHPGARGEHPGVRGEHPGARGVGKEGQPQPEGPNTNRVMEWMLDVERCQQTAGPDQRSQSSKGASKTSPRSSRSKHAHPSHRDQRALSQDRLSASWSAGHAQGHAHPGQGHAHPVQGHAHPGQGHAHYQQGPPQPQLEEARRKLEAVPAGVRSLHQSFGAPSHSNNSTLRKAAPASKQPSNPSEVTVAVYTFCHERGEPMPYRIKIPTKLVTLKAVKDFLPKKGAFRFYFKTEIDNEACFEEETEDSNPVPLWDGKVLVQCRLIE